MTRISRLAAIALGVAALATPASAADTPKRGGTLTFLIPADAPPSLDGHRETTFATIHTAAPFYSVLIRIDPNNPSNSTDFVCDLCTAVRSEEHTSELQSRPHLVCRLLLEKK